MDNTEVITTANKAQRDKLFAELRESTDPLERQVVKFSGNRMREDGKYESTWSVAYPRT